MTKDVKKEVKQLIPNKMKLAEQEQVCYMAVVEQGVTRDDLMDPTFWCHVANQLRPRFEIKVFGEDDSFYARYLVLAAEKTWARVFELEYHSLESTELTEEQRKKIFEDYEVEFGGRAKWRVIRKSDRAVLQDRMHSRGDAEKWLSVHLNSQVSSAAA